MDHTQQKNLLAAALILILIWLPLPFGSNQPMYWFYGQLALQLLSISVLVQLMRGSLGITPAFLAARLPLGLFVFLILYQFVAYLYPGFQIPADRYAAQVQLVKTVCLFQIFCLVLLLIDSERRYKWLVRALVIAGTFQAVYGTLMTVTGTDYIWGYEKKVNRGIATGTFVNRNHLAGYLEMTLAVGLGLMIANLGEGRSRTWRQFFRSWTDTLLGEKARVRICLVLMVIGLILTRSRMGNTAFFVGMGIAGLIGLFVFRRSQSGVVALFASILIIDIFLLGTYFGIEELQDRLAQTSTETEDRLVDIPLSFSLIFESPWFGHGPGSFYTVFPEVRTQEVIGINLYAHSDLVQFPVEIGIIGSIPLALLFLSSLFIAIRVQIKRHNRFYRAMGFAATMAMISIAIHSAADFNLQIFANAATFICVMAMPWLAMYLPSERRSTRHEGSLRVNPEVIPL